MESPFKVERPRSVSRRLQQLGAVEDSRHTKEDRRIFWSGTYRVWIAYEPGSGVLSYYRGCPCG